MRQRGARVATAATEEGAKAGRGGRRAARVATAATEEGVREAEAHPTFSWTAWTRRRRRSRRVWRELRR